jgi:hypothetical protein
LLELVKSQEQLKEKHQIENSCDLWMTVVMPIEHMENEEPHQTCLKCVTNIPNVCEIVPNTSCCELKEFEPSLKDGLSNE